jgi:hypothetical protein
MCIFGVASLSDFVVQLLLQVTHGSLHFDQL